MKYWNRTGESKMTPLMMNSHILTQAFALHQPATVDEAVALLGIHNAQAKVLAGGTDLLVDMKMERVEPAHIVYIGRIDSLRQIVDVDGSLTLGALATFYDVQQSAAIRHKYQALNEAAHSVSGTQIKIMGSIGGNLVNASPASDSAPALLVFDATVELASEQGVRQVALSDFFVGPGQSLRSPGELMTRIRLTAPRAGEGSAFLKLGRVGADIAKASAAVRIVRDGGAVAECRIALGSVAATPVRARTAEAHLLGKAFDLQLAETAARKAVQEITPITDVRSTATYRSQVTAVLVRDALLTAWQRADRQAPN
jgi:carbon-monoxide dehydrogenase medium subunit